MNSVRQAIYKIIDEIKPFDALEEEHKRETLHWLKSDAPIFRENGVDYPNPHLVSYFLLYDEDTSHVLLVDHKKAKLWLPSGGHVEIDENPKVTVCRECVEELGVQADFWRDQPIFITRTPTTDVATRHLDVSLWYVLRGHQDDVYDFDRDEFKTIAWFSFENIPYERTDRHMARFIEKLRHLRCSR